HVSVNIDPSDRYVLSVPGSDKYRLRPDEAGYDNLVLAGDWTDSGLNSGCIESAVLSGLQAANTILGRGRFHRIRGFYLP
ncbi:MAG TPA: FAD-dependent oxidoreductase, partial [Mycobacterium sp.]|nr:FAD-dependent oxidoreductase [Mycobacterium sp.]